MYAKSMVAILFLLALCGPAARAEEADDIKEQIKNLQVKEQRARIKFEEDMNALEVSTREQISKIEEGDKGGRLNILQERNVKLEGLREDFRKEADAARAERDRLYGELAAAEDAAFRKEQSAREQEGRKNESLAERR